MLLTDRTPADRPITIRSLLQRFEFFDTGNGPHTATSFLGLRLASFTGYIDPFFNKVVDIWVEGLWDNGSNSGRTALMHFITNESDRPGLTFSFVAVAVYLPGGSAPVFTRFSIPFNRSHILLGDDAGPAPGGSAWSTQGLAYGQFNGSTNVEINFVGEPVSALYRVASNYLSEFLYANPRIAFRGSRVLSFHCTNSGPFGKNAEFWLDGYRGESLKNAFTPAVAHVFVTDSVAPWTQYAYVAIFHPSNLSTPIHERFIFLTTGRNHILCR